MLGHDLALGDERRCLPTPSEWTGRSGPRENSPGGGLLFRYPTLSRVGPLLPGTDYRWQADSSMSMTRVKSFPLDALSSGKPEFTCSAERVPASKTRHLHAYPAGTIVSE